MIEALGELASVATVSATALVDTGAHTTVLSPDIVAALGLKPVGAINMITPTAMVPVRCEQFNVNVHFSPEVVVENILAAQAPLIDHGFQCLIGRDVLQKRHAGLHRKREPVHADVLTLVGV
jgi:predicted aspartyl protease